MTQQARHCKAGTRAWMAQSAMEYLMTYGWAILVIAVVLAALAASGVFSQTPPNICLAPAEFECNGMQLFGIGAYNITITQELNAPINITAIGCNTNQSTVNMIRFRPAIYLPINGQVAITGNASGRGFCFSGGRLFTGVIGTVFHGYVMLNYTNLYTGFKHTVAIEITQKVLNVTPPPSTTLSTSTTTIT